MDDEFSLRVGRIRYQRAPTAGRLTPSRLARRGRGQKAVAALRQASRSRALRRVIVKARIVRLKPGSAAVRAHLRYLERGAGNPEDAPGRLYDAADECVDGRAFLSRCDGDRHHFRFIVSPEDGADLDLQRFTRELMRQMEQDLGTVLDWVAVDHTDPAHPHSHILIRGRTDRGTDLLISQDYITEGLRLRARELATEELGTLTDRELDEKLLKEISQERFTRMDRQLIGRSRDGVLDLRVPLTSQRTGFREGIAGARLEALRGFGLARPLSRDVWRLSGDLEFELRQRGERGDIIKSMNRALAREGQARGAETFVTHDQEQLPVIGRVIDKGLAGPTEERAALIVDGVDGKVRRVEMPLAAADAIPMRAIVQTGSGATVADHTIADIAGRSGVYDTTEHLRRLGMSGDLVMLPTRLRRMFCSMPRTKAAVAGSNQPRSASSGVSAGGVEWACDRIVAARGEDDRLRWAAGDGRARR
jgi:type IV secretory pathway VirD2 relaxase